MANIIEKLKTQIRGYNLKQLNLLEFIDFYKLDMILNNDLIFYDNLYFELYNYSEMLEVEEEEIKNDLYNYFDVEEIEELNPEEVDELITDKATENIYYNDVYQYFIIPYNDVYLWKEYTNYPIFYSDELDIYLLGITHWGMSWDYFKTHCYIREYL